MSFTEANYENAILTLFTDTLGYSHHYGPDMERDNVHSAGQHLKLGCPNW